MNVNYLLPHLLELRRRALYVLLCFIAAFGCSFLWVNQLYELLMKPLLLTLPPGQKLISTQLTAGLVTPLTLTANSALLLSTPFALYQVWLFISPGLYHHEQQGIKGLFGLSIFLFVSGALFCFYVVLPLLFQCFVQAFPSQVHFMPDMTYALDFITRMLFLFGLAFQVPLICLLLVRLNAIKLTTLQQARSYVIVAAFIIGMLLTPPDVLSQLMLAIPLCILYEIGILIARIKIK